MAKPKYDDEKDEKTKFKEEKESLSESDDVEIKEDASSITERETWPHHMDFMLSCVGYAVGFGSIWRFPYLCMRNGGGAFLVPYLFFMIICGVPLFFMELAIGQFAGLSPAALWNICPLFKGLGWSMLVVSGIVCIYYNIILTWVLYYLVKSFAADLPWRTCGNWWNTCNCIMKMENETQASLFPDELENSTDCILLPNKTSAAEEFWKYNTLGLTEGISMENLGTVRWELLACLVVAWILIFACLCKGIKSVGKVVWVTATSPYLFLIILLVRNCLLEGSSKGVMFFLEPKWEKLRDYSIWGEAALQVFFSLGPAWGGLITMSSFNKFHNNCYRDAIVIPIINCLTSLLGGFVIFTVIGHMAHVSGVEVEKTLEVGPGITFVAYPEAIAQLPISPLWSVFFFLMLITIGLDSQFGMFETLTSSFIDEFPKHLRSKKVLFTGIMCLVELLIGLPLVMQGGIYVFTIMDWYCATFSLALIAFLEVVVVCYIYGVQRFRNDIKSMIGFKPSHFWTVMWCGVTPVSLAIVFASSVFMYKHPTYGDYEFPFWSIVFGWCLGFCSLVPIPVVMIKQIMNEEGSLLERIRKLCQPVASWGQIPSTPPSKGVIETINSGDIKSTAKLLSSSMTV